MHDVGGVAEDSPIDFTEKAFSHWERSTHALLGILLRKGKFSLDEHRRSVEALPAKQYEKQSYYERWASGITSLSIEKGIFMKSELDDELGTVPHDTTIRFHAGDVVRVRDESSAIRWRKPHLRVPGYVHGLVGTVERDCCGLYADPEALAFHEAAVRQPLYRVRFFQQDIWEGYRGSSSDTVEVEIYQAWLQAASAADLEAQRLQSASLHQGLVTGVLEHKPGGSGVGTTLPSQQDQAVGETSQGPSKRHKAEDSAHAHDDHSHDHDAHHAHDHDHPHGDHVHDHGDHVHEGSTAVETKAVELEGDDSARRRLPEALIRLLIRKGEVTHDEIRRSLEVLDSRGEQRGGPRLVARAWLDPAFKARLLEDGNAAVAELGLEGSNWGARQDVPDDCKPKEKYGTVLTVVENTPDVHNLVVCTLCSCYPISILGMSPSWYKSRAYRARGVRNPRGVLAEMGLQLPPEVSVRVHDSTADNRYLVLPQRPAGTQDFDEAQLAALVTRDAMIGVAQALAPN